MGGILSRIIKWEEDGSSIMMITHTMLVTFIHSIGVMAVKMFLYFVTTTTFKNKHSRKYYLFWLTIQFFLVYVRLHQQVYEPLQGKVPLPNKVVKFVTFWTTIGANDVSQMHDTDI